MGFKMEEAKYYNKGFYNEQEAESYKSAREVVPILNKLFSPKSILDVGCGLGTWLKVWIEDCKVEDVLGLEGPYIDPTLLNIGREKFRFVDLKESVSLERKFDLVMTLEVGEHIPTENADNFVDNLVSGGDIVVFSAALPFQEGTFHINEQPAEFWASKFEKRGYQTVDFLRKKIWTNQNICYWYRQNILFFIKRERLAEFPELQSAANSTDPEFLTHIHPELLHNKVNRIENTATIPAFVKWQLYLLKIKLKNIFK